MRNNINNLYSYPAFSGMTKSAAGAPRSLMRNLWDNSKWFLAATGGTLAVGAPASYHVGKYVNDPKNMLSDIYVNNDDDPDLLHASHVVLNHINGKEDKNKTDKPANTANTVTPNPEQEVSSVSDFFDKHPALAWTGVGALGLGALGLGAYAMSDDDDNEDDERKYYNRNTPPRY